VVHELKPDRERRSIKQISTEIILAIAMLIVAAVGFTLAVILFS
jgi:hypothetical protein